MSDVCWPLPFPMSVGHFHFPHLLTTSISHVCWPLPFPIHFFDIHSYRYGSMNNLNFQVFTSVVVQMVVIFCAFMPCADLSSDVSEEHTTSIHRVTDWSR